MTGLSVSVSVSLSQLACSPLLMEEVGKCIPEEHGSLYQKFMMHPNVKVMKQAHQLSESNNDLQVTDTRIST